MTIGDRIEQVRADFGLTQAEITDKIGVKLRTYTRYISGETSPPADVLDAIGKLGVNLHWLITGHGEMLAAPTTAEAASAGLTAIDEELNARVVEAVSAVYKECGGRISPRDLGRTSAEIYNDIAQAGLATWDEKMGALGFAAAQLRRRLLAPPTPDTGSAKANGAG